MKRLLLFAGIALAATLLMVVVVLVFLVWREAAVEGGRFRAVLAEARSVTVREYALSRGDGTFGELLKEKTLTPAEAAALARAFSGWGLIDGGKACEFEPHQQVLCTMRDGATREIRICFQCNDAQLDSGRVRDIGPWREALKTALGKADMPVRLDKYRYEN